MEKDRVSVTRHRRIGVVADLDQPAIGEIPQPHLRLLVPGWRIVRVDFNMLIIVRATHVIDPGVSRFHRVEGLVRTVRERLVIRVDNTDFEDSCRRPVVPLELSWPNALPDNLAAPPRQSVLAEKHIHWLTHLLAFTVSLLQPLEFAIHDVPGCRDPDDDVSYPVTKLRCRSGM